MGGVRRQRKYKACDPFNKQKKRKQQENENKFDLEPNSKRGKLKDDHFGETKSFVRFQAQLDKATSKKTKGRTEERKSIKTIQKKPRKGKQTKSDDLKASIQPKANESQKQYFQRLDNNIKEAVDAAMMETKTLRKKRKQHLKERHEKLKMKKKKHIQEEEKDFSSLKDDVSFGDVANQPPTISALPRKASTENKKNRQLHLSSLLDNTSKTTGMKKLPKDMDTSEREQFDIERQRAIDAYRLIKKGKELKGS